MLVTFRKQPNKKCLGYLPKLFWIIKDVAIISLGVAGFIFGTFALFYRVIKHQMIYYVLILIYLWYIYLIS